jgi:hypothetical protein
MSDRSKQIAQLVLHSFICNSAFEEYQEDLGFTEAEYAVMMDELANEVSSTAVKTVPAG